MKYLIVIAPLIFFTSTFSQSTFTICSWNLKDFGKSKDNEELNVIAEILKDFDVVAIQEVVAGYGGGEAVARLATVLNGKGSKWDYSISDPTSSSSYKTERYAYLWKPGRIKKIGKSWLEKEYNLEIDREPYYSTFQFENKFITLVNFHAITKKRQPEREVKYFKYLPIEYQGKNLVFCGDFNLPESHTVFNPLKSMGYSSVFIGQKTSLRQKCIHNDCLASEFDNFFLNPSKISVKNLGAVHFYKKYSTLRDALAISDHIPIFIKCSL